MSNYYKIPINPNLIRNDMSNDLKNSTIINNMQFFNILRSYISRGDMIYLYTLTIEDESVLNIVPREHYDDIKKLTDITDIIKRDNTAYTEFHYLYGETWSKIEIVSGSKMYNDSKLIISKYLGEKVIYSHLLSFIVLQASDISGPINIDISRIYDKNSAKPPVSSFNILDNMQRLFDTGLKLYGTDIPKHRTLEETLMNNPILTTIRNYDEWLDVVLAQQIGVKEIVYNETDHTREFFKIENIRPVPLYIFDGDIQYENYSSYHKAFRSNYSIHLIGNIVSYREYKSIGDEPSTVEVLMVKYNARLGDIPLMTGSKYSPIGQYLSKIPESRWDEALSHIDSSKFTFGGYYITYGMPRIYVNQKLLSINKPHVYMSTSKETKDILVSTVTSSTDLGDSTSNFYIIDNVIMFYLRKMNKIPKNIMVLVELFGNLIGDKEYTKNFLIDQIKSYCYNIVFNKVTNIHEVSKVVDKIDFYINSTLYQYNNYYSQNIMAELYSKSTEIYQNWLPQISMNKFDPGYYINKNTIINEVLSKFYFTSILVGNIILANLDLIKLTDLNSQTNIKIKNSMDLTSIHTRRVFDKAIEKFLKEKLSQQPGKAENILKSRLNSLERTIFADMENLTYQPLKTLKWGGIIEKTTGRLYDGYIEAPDPDTNIAFYTSFSKVVTNTNKQTTDMEVRSFHRHDHGFIGGVRTPESKACGLNEHLATGATFPKPRSDNIILMMLGVKRNNISENMLNTTMTSKSIKIWNESKQDHIFILPSEFNSLVRYSIDNKINISYIAPREFMIDLDIFPGYVRFEQYSHNGDKLRNLYITLNNVNNASNYFSNEPGTMLEIISDYRYKLIRDIQFNMDNFTGTPYSIVLNGKFIGWTDINVYSKLEQLKRSIQNSELDVLTQEGNKIQINIRKQSVYSDLKEFKSNLENFILHDSDIKSYKIFIDNDYSYDVSDNILNFLNDYSSLYDIQYYDNNTIRIISRQHSTYNELKIRLEDFISKDDGSKVHRLFINEEFISDVSQDIYEFLDNYSKPNAYDISYYTFRGVIYIDTDGTRMLAPIINKEYLDDYTNGELDNRSLEYLVNNGIVRYVSANEIWNNNIYIPDEDKWVENMKIDSYEDIVKDNKILGIISDNIIDLSKIRDELYTDFVEFLVHRNIIDPDQPNVELTSGDISEYKDYVVLDELKTISYEDKVFNILDLDKLNNMISQKQEYLDRKNKVARLDKYFDIRDLTIEYTAMNIFCREHCNESRNMYQCSMNNQISEVKSSSDIFNNSGDVKKMLYGTSQPYSSDYIENAEPTLIYIGSLAKNQEDLIIMNSNIRNFCHQYGLLYKSVRLDIEKSKGEVVKQIAGSESAFIDMTLVTTETDYPIDHLGPDGIVRRGTTLVPGLPIYTYVRTIGHNKVFRAKMAKEREYGYVDKVIMSVDEKGNTIVTLKIIQYMTVSSGDKFHDICGAQKGTTYLMDYWKLPYTDNGTMPMVIFAPEGYPSRVTPGHTQAAFLLNAQMLTNFKHNKKLKFAKNSANAVKELIKYGSEPSTLYSFTYKGSKLLNKVAMITMIKYKVRHLAEQKIKAPNIRSSKMTESGQPSKSPKLSYMFLRVAATLELTELIRSLKESSDIITVPYCTSCNISAMYRDDKNVFQCKSCESAENVINFDLRRSFTMFKNYMTALGIAVDLFAD